MSKHEQETNRCTGIECCNGCFWSGNAFDPLSDLDRVEPVVTMLPGWEQDISGCTRWDELPEAAKNYVQFLEKQLDHEIQFVSTGAEREKFVLKGAWL